MTSRGSASKGRPRSTKHLGIKLVGAAVMVVLIGWLIYATVNILHPTQGQLQGRSDAVVSLAPQTHRLSTAQELIGNGMAETLMISYYDHDPLNGSSGASEASGLLSTYCDSDPEYEILCFTPEENATIGEAYAISNTAHQRSWESLTVVTDTTHAFRTRFILNSCLGNDFDINVVVAERDLSASELAWHAVYENAAFAKAAWQTTWRC
ncbi:MAG TPA: hypothetical protein VIG67_08165 [Yaniella sp.]